MTGAGLILVAALIGFRPRSAGRFRHRGDPDPHPVGLQRGRLPRRGDRSGRFQAVPPRWRPRRDYEAVVHELEGRRVNLARPDGEPDPRQGDRPDRPRGGRAVFRERRGRRAAPDLDRAGAPRLEARRLRDLVVDPARKVVEAVGSEVAIRVTARFDDGSVEDVTALDGADSGRAPAVELRRSNESSLAVVHRPGRNVVIARYLDRVIPVQLIVPMADRPVDLTGEPRRNLIDEAVLATLGTLRIPSLADVRRRDVSPSRPDRPHRPAAGGRRGPGVPGRSRPRQSASGWSTAARLGRVRRVLDLPPRRDSSGSGRKGNDVEARGDVPSLGPRAGLIAVLVRGDGPLPPDRDRRHAPERPGELPPRRRRSPVAGGVRGAGVPRGPAPVCELPQPPARPLDPGRLSRPRRRLRAPGAGPRGQGRRARRGHSPAHRRAGPAQAPRRAASSTARRTASPPSPNG